MVCPAPGPAVARRLLETVEHREEVAGAQVVLQPPDLLALLRVEDDLRLGQGDLGRDERASDQPGTGQEGQSLRRHRGDRADGEGLEGRARERDRLRRRRHLGGQRPGRVPRQPVDLLDIDVIDHDHLVQIVGEGPVIGGDGLGRVDRAASGEKEGRGEQGYISRHLVSRKCIAKKGGYFGAVRNRRPPRYYIFSARNTPVRTRSAGKVRTGRGCDARAPRAASRRRYRCRWRVRRAGGPGGRYRNRTGSR